jgi:S-adenosylmethionine hydrolase
MTERYDTISFLSDHGRTDEFVGLVHSVVHHLAPGTHVIDVTHEIDPHDVRGGGLTLARAAQYLCSGVVLVSVDTVTPSPRPSVAVEVGGGASVLVGPDNGVLAPAVAMVGGADRAVRLTNEEYFLPTSAARSEGRDVLAPAAAHLCAGVPLDELGEEADPAGLMPATFPLTRFEDGKVLGEVLWVDRFGNVQLNVDPDELFELGQRFELFTGTEERRAGSVGRVGGADQLGTGEVGIVLDAYGMLSVVANRFPAAEQLRIAAGDAITLVPVDDDAASGVTTQVSLGRTSPTEDRS